MAHMVACPPRESDLLMHHGGGTFPAVGWSALENFTQRIICLIEPTVQSERTRRTVVDYVQRLVGSLLGAKVSALGSMPFKTYLSDGDIDLTVFSPSLENLASNIHNILQGEEKNVDTEIDVKDVQYIHAEIPLVKCLVENIVVDISFNQAGGLHTLHFLEKVDNFIGKDHLFKRSVMLIKAWCYYESRILGSTHGLLSTYALEILILYIFHLFHSKLAGPLSVLYRFLDYFSKFDWDCYCISLYGPVRVSSLPDIIVGPLENDGDHLLFPVEFLDEFVSSPDISENNHRLYAKKHLNIIDPLKSYNNLGRSVSKGNLFRIQSAFKYGAKQLHETLQTSEESMECELRKFFANTIERHECRERSDIQYKSNLPDNTPSSFGDDSNLPKEINTENSMRDNMGIPAYTDNCHGKSYVRQNGIRRLNLVKQNGLELESQSWFSNDYPVENQRYDYSNVSAKTSQVRVDVNNLPNQRFINQRRLSPATTVADGFSFDHEEDMREDTSQSKTIPSHKYINGLASSPNVFDLDQEQKFPYYNGIPCWDNESSLQFPFAYDQTAYENSGAIDSAEVRRNDPMDQDYPIDHGQWSKNCNLNIIVPEWNPSMPFCRKSPRDALQRWNNVVPHRHRIIPSPPFSPDTSYEPGFKLGFNGMEGFPKSRGTGTYFPIMSLQNNRHYKDGQLKGCESLAEMRNKNDKKNCESTRQPPRPALVNAPERLLQFGTLGPVSVPLPDHRTLEANGGNSHGSLNCSSKSPASSSSPGSIKHSAAWKKTQTSSTASEKPQTTSTSSPKASKSTGLETKELSMEYKLKDEDEFPPLNTSGINVSVQKNLENTAWGKSTRS